MNTNADKGMAFSNSWRTYGDRQIAWIGAKARYSLVLGQCTMVLLDKMKQDADWQVVSDSYNPLKLLKLIEKIIIEQSDDQFKIGIIMGQLKILLACSQDDGLTNAAYYDRFETRVDVAEHIDVSFNNPVLWDLKSQELYSVGYDLLLDPIKEAKVKEDVKQVFMVTYSSPIATIRSIVS